MPVADPVLSAFAATLGREAARGSAAPLVVTPRAGRAARSWTAADLDGAARELERRLAGEGFGAGDAVGLAAAPGPALLAGYLALRRRGAVPVLCDSARPTADRLAALDQLGVVGFLAEATGWPASAADWVLDRRTPPRRLEHDPDWGAIKLTSGSTGAPRGIAVPAESLLADEAQLFATMGLRAGDRFLAALPLSHSYGFSSLLLPALVRGSLLVVPADRASWAPLAAAAAAEATVFPTVPAWLGVYVRSASAPALPPSVRLVLSAGAPLPPEVAAGFRGRTGRSVHVFYGASECGGIAYDREGGAAERGTVGPAVEGVSLELEPASDRLVVRSAALAERYLPDDPGAPGATAPELAHGRFRTADLARFEAGEVRLLGRADDWILVRGLNVNPREVERVLRELAGVEEASVFGAEGPDGPGTLLRAVVAAPGGLDPARVLDFCRGRLAEHKVPRSVVVVGELPRTSRGKLDRAELLALAAVEP